MVIDKGSEVLMEDFNFKNILDRTRLSEFETKILDSKNIINYNDYKQDHVILLFEKGIKDYEKQVHEMEDRLKDKLKTELERSIYGNNYVS